MASSLKTSVLSLIILQCKVNHRRKSAHVLYPNFQNLFWERMPSLHSDPESNSTLGHNDISNNFKKLMSNFLDFYRLPELYKYLCCQQKDIVAIVCLEFLNALIPLTHQSDGPIQSHNLVTLYNRKQLLNSKFLLFIIVNIATDLMCGE